MKRYFKLGLSTLLIVGLNANGMKSPEPISTASSSFVSGTISKPLADPLNVNFRNISTGLLALGLCGLMHWSYTKECDDKLNDLNRRFNALPYSPSPSYKKSHDFSNDDESEKNIIPRAKKRILTLFYGAIIGIWARTCWEIWKK